MTDYDRGTFYKAVEDRDEAFKEVYGDLSQRNRNATPTSKPKSRGEGKVVTVSPSSGDWVATDGSDIPRLIKVLKNQEKIMPGTLSDWERDFLESIERYAAKGKLSPKQYATLKKIHKKHF